MDETIRKLYSLNMPHMAQALRALSATKGAEMLSFEERIGLLVDREWVERDGRRVGRKIRQAHVDLDATLEDLWCDADRGVDLALAEELGHCGFLLAKQNILITGSTGTGKTYLCRAITLAACRRGHNAYYARVPRLVAELSAARRRGDDLALLKRISRAEILVLDDFLVTSLRKIEQRDVLEVIEDRFDRGVVIVASPVPATGWCEALGSTLAAQAICDRLCPGARLIALSGPSLRGEVVERHSSAFRPSRPGDPPTRRSAA
jgi:DNA replication protein DnaC